MVRVRRQSAFTVRVGSIVIRVDDIEREKAFWTSALDYVAGIDRPCDFGILRPRQGDGPNTPLDGVRSEVHIPLGSTSTYTPTTKPARSGA